MFASYLIKQESVNSLGFLAPYAGLEAPLATPRADTEALCKSARREMRSQMQIAKRFANQSKAKKQFNRSTLMTVKNKLAALAFVAIMATAAGGAAQAQTALTNGVTFESGTLSGSYTTIDLGSNAGMGISSMPLSLSYANVNVNMTFTGGSGVASTGVGWNPTPGQNFLAVPGTATLQFSSAQSFFGAMWSSPDNSNMLSFYNGSQLLASMSGAQFRSASGAVGLSTGTQAAFNFSELGYDKVVVTSANTAFVEIGAISFSDQAVDVAPIPLNAASLGGLLSFLMMLGMRGKGGTQVAIRMAFASIIPRRRVVA